MLYLTLRHYEYVAAIAQHGSLSAAANALNVSQPALSAALSRIEAHLNKTLFIRRKGAPLALTPQGREFASSAQGVLAQAAELETTGMTQKGPARLVIGCFGDLAPFFLSQVLHRLRAALPDVQLSFREGGFDSLIDGLKTGDCDLAITYDLGLDASFSRARLTSVRPQAVMAADHPLAKEDAPITLTELATQPLILSQEGLSLTHMIGLFKPLGLIPKVAHRTASLELLRSLAAAGEGIGLAYSLPQTNRTYDGNQLTARYIQDAHVPEPIVLAAHGTPASDSPLGRAISTLSNSGISLNGGD